MNNAIFAKNKENVKKHRDIKFITMNKKRNYLVLEPNSYTTKPF